MIDKYAITVNEMAQSAGILAPFVVLVGWLALVVITILVLRVVLVVLEAINELETSERGGEA